MSRARILTYITQSTACIRGIKVTVLDRNGRSVVDDYIETPARRTRTIPLVEFVDYGLARVLNWIALLAEDGAEGCVLREHPAVA